MSSNSYSVCKLNKENSFSYDIVSVYITLHYITFILAIILISWQRDFVKQMHWKIKATFIISFTLISLLQLYMIFYFDRNGIDLLFWQKAWFTNPSHYSSDKMGYHPTRICGNNAYIVGSYIACSESSSAYHSSLHWLISLFILLTILISTWRAFEVSFFSSAHSLHFFSIALTILTDTHWHCSLTQSSNGEVLKDVFGPAQCQSRK